MLAWLARHQTKIICLLPLLVVAQGYIVFRLWTWGTATSFLSMTGLQCSFTPLVAEGAFFILCLMHADRIAGNANPHSPISQSIRPSQQQQQAAPPTRTAWDGEWGRGGDLGKE